jgi:hypothetical protein
MKDLRYRILKLLKEFTLLQITLHFYVIANRFKTKSYKNVSMQLSWLKSKGFVGTKGSLGTYEYFITPQGILYLNHLEAKRLRKKMTTVMDAEVELYEPSCCDTK